MLRANAVRVVTGLVLLAAGLLLAVPARAATVVNGDFEAGNLSGWQVFNSTTNGNWFAYTGTKTPFEDDPVVEPIELIELEPVEPEPKEPAFYAPPQGNWAAVTDEHHPDTAILYQDIALEPYYSQQLTITAYYRSRAPIFVPNPNTLAVSDAPPMSPEESQRNQQLRIDVVKPTAPLESLSPADVLTTVFANKTGDPKEMAPTQFGADLTPFAGQTVRLRIANAVNDGIFNAGVDSASITSTPPSNAFKKGKLKLNKANGTATLTVTVPGPGVLKLTDAASTKKASASKKKPKLLKPATVKPTKAGNVKVPVRATAAGRKALEKKGKLRVRGKLTFTPTGGLAATQSLKATLKQKP